jgi:hypothetical protein
VSSLDPQLSVRPDQNYPERATGLTTGIDSVDTGICHLSVQLPDCCDICLVFLNNPAADILI